MESTILVHGSNSNRELKSGPRKFTELNQYFQEVHSFSIESLQSGAEYMVRVQALIIKPPRKVTPGQVATLRFRTPVMKSRHIGKLVCVDTDGWCS